jgi:hypothetical protein
MRQSILPDLCFNQAGREYQSMNIHLRSIGKIVLFMGFASLAMRIEAEGFARRHQ